MSEKEELLRKIEETAYKYEIEYHGCSQCVLKALQTHLNLGNGDAFKAATAFAGGYADMGDICGALSGGFMAIGLACGRDRLEETSVSSGYQKASKLSLKLYERFKKEFGGVRCWDVQDSVFGRHFDGLNPAETVEFEKAKGYEKCANVVKKAAQLAGEIILEEEG
jgi:C_GCAxxG_C_C family probable redox protein